MFGEALKGFFPRRISWWLALRLGGGCMPVLGQTDQQVYTDSLQNGWQDWGWATLSYTNHSPVHSGSASIAVTIANSYEAIYIAHSSFDSTSYSTLSFWVN